MKKRGLIISFEGIDGCGKTTQAKLFYRRLKKQGMKVILLNEPGGTCAGDNIRKMLLDKKSEISPLCELFMYLASRAQLIAEVITPNVKNGTAVILDRYVDSTIAYQGWGRGLSVSLIERIHRAFASGVMPDITFLIDDTADNLACVLGKKDRDRIERESVKFHNRVRDGYLWIAKRNRNRVKVIKRKTMSGTQAEIIKEWESFINESGRKQKISRKKQKAG